MKKVILSSIALLSVLSLSLAIFQTSCSTDKCKNVTCLNGGTCNSGTCSCATGYYGSKCDSAWNNLAIGSWITNDSCSSTNPFTTNVTASTSGGARIYFDKLEASSATWYADMTSKTSFNIPSQTLTYSGVTVTLSGSGTMSSKSNINLNYLLTVGGSSITCGKVTMTR